MSPVDEKFIEEARDSHDEAVLKAIEYLYDKVASSEPTNLLEYTNRLTNNNLMTALQGRTPQQLTKYKGVKNSNDMVLKRVWLTAKIYCVAKNEGKNAAIIWKLSN